MPAAIEIKDLRKRYDDVEAVSGVSFEVQEGRFFGFLGPNGAGKTTTINIITGLTNRTSGDVRVFGKDVSADYRSCRRRIGLAPQEFNFDRFFSIRKLLEFEAGYFGLAPKSARQRIEELFEKFGLTEKANKPSQELSGGLKRRLLLVKALIHDPDILILDEPTAGVDLELRHELWDYLRELNRRGKTIVLTTHYLEEAEALCEEVVILHKGKIVEQGMTKDLMARSKKSLEELFLEHISNNKEKDRGKVPRGLDPI